MKKTKIIIYNPNIEDNTKLRSSFDYLKNVANNRLIYLWVDTQTEEKQFFNIQKGLLTKLSSKETSSILLNLMNSLKKIKENYNVNTAIKQITINYRIL